VPAVLQGRKLGAAVGDQVGAVGRRLRDHLDRTVDGSSLISNCPSATRIAVPAAPDT
jgi:hypothetical protein